MVRCHSSLNRYSGSLKSSLNWTLKWIDSRWSLSLLIFLTACSEHGSFTQCGLILLIKASTCWADRPVWLYRQQKDSALAIPISDNPNRSTEVFHNRHNCLITGRKMTSILLWTAVFSPCPAALIFSEVCVSSVLDFKNIALLRDSCWARAQK